MTCFIAQRGTRVALIDAGSARLAGPIAAKALRLARCRPRRRLVWDRVPCDCGQGIIRKSRIVGPDDHRWYGGPRFDAWPFDWRDATLRPASRVEVETWQAAKDQVHRLSGLRWRRLREAMQAEAVA